MSFSSGYRHDDIRDGLEDYIYYLLEEACPLLTKEERLRIAKEKRDDAFSYIEEAVNDQDKDAEDEIKELADELKDLKDKVASLESELETAEESIKDYEESTKNYEKMQADFEELQSRVPHIVKCQRFGL